MCPFCTARHAMQVYETGVTITAAADDVWCLISVESEAETLLDGGRSHYRKTRSVHRRIFLDVIEAFRADAAVFTSQVAPRLPDSIRFKVGDFEGIEDHTGFLVRHALLMKISAERLLDFVEADINHIDTAEPILPLRELGNVQVVLHEPEEWNAFRWGVFGQRPGHPKAVAGEGHRGAVQYAQWHLGSLSQWEQFVKATAHTKQYELFGRWPKGPRRRRRPADAPPAAPAEPCDEVSEPDLGEYPCYVPAAEEPARVHIHT